MFRIYQFSNRYFQDFKITEYKRVLQSVTKYYKVLESINLAHLLGPILSLLHEGLKLKLNKRVNIWGKITNKKNPLYVPVTILYHMFYSDDINGGVATSKNITVASVLLEAGWIVNIREVLSPTIFNFRFIFLLLWLYLFHIFLPNCYVLLHPIYCFWVIFFNKRCFLFDFNG